MRNYSNWLANARVEPENATREQIRAYLVQMASSGLVSAGYCRQARAALIVLYETVLKQPDKVGDPSTLIQKNGRMISRGEGNE